MAAKVNNNAIKSIREAIQKNELIIIAGSGISAGLVGNLSEVSSWSKLIESGFKFALDSGKISSNQLISWKHQIESQDIDDLLSAAEFITRKLEGPNGILYGRWLENIFKDAKPKRNSTFNSIRALNSLNVPVATTNYDSLLEIVTGHPAINLLDQRKAAKWVRREIPGIMHLHGCWDVPESCILGIRDYESAVKDESRQLIQRTLGIFKKILFLGCGGTLGDPNFSALLNWMKNNFGASTPSHYALVKDSDVSARRADPIWQGYVEPVSYGDRHEDLPKFLKTISSGIIAGKKTVRRNANNNRDRQKLEVRIDKEIISEYCEYVIKDCGQMTIEGVRADMDTAQRKFDLERLFVPLDLQACPPEIPLHDKKREEKLEKWKEKENDPVSFSSVFQKNKKIALLALPGGGKTLLLKRLAVAYADSERRLSSQDNLPNLDATPIIIKCREWRDKIRKPILTLLQSIYEITGRIGLKGLSEALVPRLKSGHALLLVDGLDEIHDDADRMIFVENLENFLDEYNKIRFIVTSREAGFDLVAPCLARFCKSFRVAPLSDLAIRGLCAHWHELMGGKTPESNAEGAETANLLMRNPSLRRLAENPLLLTMLLVVKHGAGRLPPDRVSLYERAVEVLLDTWNIKGHAALNPKEAVPQLSFIAFRLMIAGRQTATLNELLSLVEEAREEIPQIRRYARDTPDEFLKRVELRSSLLVKAGHQIEDGKPVSFYQFRHLTFQEYLAAIAAFQGHYTGYQKDHTVLTPLKEYLTDDRWKEVIPMTAVLAGKQAEPLLAALVDEGGQLKKMLISGDRFPGETEWADFPTKLPSSISRIIQCLVEEAELSQEALSEALQQIVFFCRGARSIDNWSALVKGLYGNDLLDKAWSIYQSRKSPPRTWVRNTLGMLSIMRENQQFWETEVGKSSLIQSMKSKSKKERSIAFLTAASLRWGGRYVRIFNGNDTMRELFERNIVKESDTIILEPAIWCWGLDREHRNTSGVNSDVVYRIVDIWLTTDDFKLRDISAFALAGLSDTKIDEWKRPFSSQEKELIRKNIDSYFSSRNDDEGHHNDVLASLVIAVQSKDIWKKNEVESIVLEIKSRRISQKIKKPPLQHLNKIMNLVAEWK